MVLSFRKLGWVAVEPTDNLRFAGGFRKRPKRHLRARGGIFFFFRRWIVWKKREQRANFTFSLRTGVPDTFTQELHIRRQKAFLGAKQYIP